MTAEKMLRDDKFRTFLRLQGVNPRTFDLTLEDEGVEERVEGWYDRYLDDGSDD